MADRKLSGTWVLVSNDWLAADGSIVSSPFGPEPLGQLIYGRDGCMSAIFAAPDRPLAARPREGRVEDKSAAFDTLLAYSGTYEVRGDIVVHHVEVGSIPADVGRDRIRGFRIEGDGLTLLAPSTIVDGQELTHRIIWRRRSGG